MPPFYGLGSYQPVPAQTSDITLAMTFNSANQKIEFQADQSARVDNVNGAFFNPETNKFYSTMTVTPQAGISSFPYSTTLGLMKKSEGKGNVQVVGHERNGFGSPITLHEEGLIWFGGSNCNVFNILVGGLGCAQGFTTVKKPAGTYSCSASGLGVNDPAHGTPKHCEMQLKINVFKVIQFPLATIAYSNEVNVY